MGGFAHRSIALHLAQTTSLLRC